MHPYFLSSTTQEFHYIIQSYCKNRLGNRFIERADYELVGTVGHGSTSLSEFTSVVKPGMSVELSIIVRQTALLQEEQKCLRCGFANSVVTAQNVWIEWQMHLHDYIWYFVNSHH